MSESEDGASNEKLPEAVIVRRRGFSAVWLVPLVAAGIAASLLYSSFERSGKTVEIGFANASDVEAGKTRVRYRNVVIGTVDTVRLSDDFTHTVVKAQINQNGEPLLVDGTRFWVERPRIGPEGISGLTTLVSGAYIALDPGTLGGVPTLHYQGLPNPPQMLKGDTGLHLVLNSPQGAVGLSHGSPVVNKGIQVGRITGLDLAKGKTGAEIRISIDAEYADRVFHRTRFWNASGIDVRADLSGFDVDFESLETILTGAIEFATPGRGRRASANGHHYSLFGDRAAAFRKYQEGLGLHVFVRAPRLASLADGDSVLYRGVEVGRVLGHELEDDSRHVRLRVQIEPRYAPLVRSNSVFWNASGISSDIGLTGVHIHVSSLEALLKGAISLATPDPPGPLAEPEAEFELEPKSKKKWLEWAPNIALAPDQGTEAAD